MEATTGHQASERQRQRQKEKERENTRWGRMEHIDGKLDLGDIRFGASNVLISFRTHVLGNCEHTSYICITLSLVNNIHMVLQ